MSRHVVLPVLAGALLLFAVGYALYVQRPEAETPPPVPPPTSPFGQTVTGAGMVEPSTHASGTAAIAVGSQLSGVVTNVCVRVGQSVEAGTVLLELDRRQAQADYNIRKAALGAAKAQLRKLERQPRPEEVPVSEAQVRAAEANVKQQQDQVERDRRIAGTPALAEQDRIAHVQALNNGRAQLELAQANLALLKAGAWEPDLAIARAGVEQAQAQLDQAQTTLDLLQVMAPVAGTILQVNVRPGEYVATYASQSLIVIGNLDPLHVRVSIDEEDLPRLKLKAPARAKLRGDARQEQIPLTFDRLELFVVPKVSLTGANTERVDTRVVQVIYAVHMKCRAVQEGKLLVGQLVDVFIDTSAAASPEERDS
jgi:multidrug efflux pump subunit AcrA (membrane-fusion protein)